MSRLRPRPASLLALALAGAWSSGCASGARLGGVTPGEGDRFFVAGYHPYWTGDSWRAYPWDVLDEVYYFEIDVGAEGGLAELRGWPEQGGPLLDRARAEDVRVVPTISLHDAAAFAELFARPIMWVLVAINIASAYIGLKYRPTLETEGSTRKMTASDMTPQIIFLGLVIVGIAYTFYDVRGMSFLGRIFPQCAGALALVFALIGFVSLMRRNPDSPMAFDSEAGWRDSPEGYKVGLYYYIAWLTGFMVLTALVGFILAIGIFFVVFLRHQSDAKWSSILAMAGSAVGALMLLGYVFTLQFPGGVLQDMVAMPWPFD